MTSGTYGTEDILGGMAETVEGAETVTWAVGQATEVTIDVTRLTAPIREASGDAQAPPTPPNVFYKASDDIRSTIARVKQKSPMTDLRDKRVRPIPLTRSPTTAFPAYKIRVRHTT